MYVENGSSMSEKERRAGTVVVVAVSAALDIQPILRLYLMCHCIRHRQQKYTLCV